MTKIIGQVVNPVPASAAGQLEPYDSKTPSIFGLPGSGLPAAYMHCVLSFRAAVDENMGVWLGIDNGGYMEQLDIYGNDFPCYFCARKNPFTAYPGDRTGQFITWHMYPGGHSDHLVYTFSTNTGTIPEGVEVNMANYDMVYIGQITDFNWEEIEVSGGTQMQGSMYVGGTAEFTNIDDYVYPEAMKIVFYGLEQYLDYFPWAILKSSMTSWESCNRAGGSLQIRKSNAWRDCKNVAGSGSTSDTVHRRASSAWTKCAKIGNNAR